MVGCHPGTTPLGNLANAKLRIARKDAHASFEATCSAVEEWMREKMGE
jgi:hypothetical protein